MMLRTGEMQRIGCPQAKVAAEFSGLQVDRFGHVQCCEPLEQRHIGPLQYRVAALDWPDQTLAFDQR